VVICTSRFGVTPELDAPAAILDWLGSMRETLGGEEFVKWRRVERGEDDERLARSQLGDGGFDRVERWFAALDERASVDDDGW
jgi:hypothetical protein